MRNNTCSTRSRAAAILGTAALISLAACASPQQSSSTFSGAVSKSVLDAVAKEDPVVLADMNYTSQVLATEITKQVLEAMGAKVSTQPMDPATSWPAIARDPNLAAMEMWPPLYKKQIAEYADKAKSVELLDNLGYATKEGWWVPNYVIKGDPKRNIKASCPGLPDWKALNSCAKVFATASTGSKGRYLAGAEAWAVNYGDQPRIDNLGLNYKMEFAGSEAALVAEIKRSFDRGEPLLFLMWTPHFAVANGEFTMIQFPPYSDDCWGTTYACGWAEDKNIGIANSTFKDTHPLAYQMLQNFDLPDESMQEIVLAVDGKGATVEGVVKDWMTNNEAIWKSWIPTRAAQN